MCHSQWGWIRNQGFLWAERSHHLWNGSAGMICFDHGGHYPWSQKWADDGRWTSQEKLVHCYMLGTEGNWGPNIWDANSTHTDTQTQKHTHTHMTWYVQNWWARHKLVVIVHVDSFQLISWWENLQEIRRSWPQSWTTSLFPADVPRKREVNYDFMCFSNYDSWLETVLVLTFGTKISNGTYDWHRRFMRWNILEYLGIYIYI